MFTKPISGVELIEIKTTNITNKYYFQDYARLRGKIVHRLDIYSGITYTPSNREQNSYANAFLVLVNRGGEVINRIELQYLGQAYFYPEFNLSVDWSKSYIEFSSTSSLSTAKSLLVTVYVVDKLKEYIPAALKCEYVECVITSTTELVFDFKEQAKLKNKKIIFITYFGSNSPNGNTAAADEIISKSFLTLNVNGQEKINNLPIYLLSNNASKKWYRNYAGIIVDWDKSYVRVANTDSLVANTTIGFNVFYEDQISGSLSNNNKA